MKYFLIAGVVFQTLLFAQRRGPVLEFLTNPFKRTRERREAAHTYYPVFNKKGERIIAINGIAVPRNARGIKIQEGEISFVFRDGSESPASTPPSGVPSAPSVTPDLGSTGHTPGVGAQPSAPERPQATGEEKNNPGASARPAPSAIEQTQGGSSEESPKTSGSDLFPAGKNGNPGFPFKVLGPDFSEKCQATLISQEKGLCMAATAAHCLFDGAQRSLDKGIDKTTLASQKCHSDVAQRGLFWAKGQIETADFGKVEATFFVNPEYHSGTKSEDSAVFTFPCKQESSVKPVSVSTQPLQEGEKVFYGKVMGGKEGLYEGSVWREPGVVGINSRPVGEAQEAIVQPQDVAIQQGDSGGGIYRKKGDGSFELVGVLSTSDDITRRRPIGNYATNRSLQFIQCIKKAFGRA